MLAKLKMAMIFWLARRLPTCEEVAPWMSEALDERLPIGRRVKLRLHIWICAWCARYEKQLAFLRQAMREHAARAEGPDAGETLSPEARERIKRALNQNEDR